MADRGIIFSAPMVRALLDGRKTQTRRLLNPQPIEHEGMNCRRLRFVRRDGTMVGDASPDLLNDGSCPAAIFTPYAPGDRLYVREHWKTSASLDHAAPRDLPRDCSILLLADNSVPTKAFRPPWGRHRQGMQMPRWASRLWLAVTDVRVQRVAEISEADAVAEGLKWTAPGMWSVARNLPIIGDDPRVVFSELWNSLHTKPGETWEANPWVVAVTFTVAHGNIDRSQQ